MSTWWTYTFDPYAFFPKVDLCFLSIQNILQYKISDVVIITGFKIINYWLFYKFWYLPNRDLA